MYRTYNLSGTEQLNLVISQWDGDCTVYTVYNSIEEKNADKLKRDTIESEYQQQLKEYNNF